jgi:hypothetical protein
MAVITITQGFGTITSVYNPIIINFIRDEVIPVSCSLQVGSITKTITPVLIASNTFTMDLTEVIKYMMPMPPNDVNSPQLLTTNVTLTITMAGATNKTTSTVACYGHRVLDLTSKLGEDFPFDFTDMYDYGRSPRTNLPIYTDGFVSFYNKNVEGVYTAEIEGAFTERQIKFGLLYNQSIARSENMGLNGFDTPTYDDCVELRTLAGGTLPDLSKYKSTDSAYWDAPNTGAENLFGLDLRGGGTWNGSLFFLLKNGGLMWHKTGLMFIYSSNGYDIIELDYPFSFCSLRLTKPATTEQLLLDNGTRVEDYTDYEGNRYVCRKIGSKIWMCENLITKFTANGLPITGGWKAYDNNEANAYVDTISEAVTAEYYLREGYNNIELPFSARKTGTFTLSFSGTTISLPLIYRDNSEFEDERVYWLNSNGCWSRWNFNKVAIIYDSKEDERLPLRQTSTLYIGDSKTLSKSKEVSVNLETIAVNPDHYALLCEIMETPMLVYRGLIWEVVQQSKEIATCKQNLYFNLTLKTKQNVIKY